MPEVNQNMLTSLPGCGHKYKKNLGLLNQKKIVPLNIRVSGSYKIQSKKWVKWILQKLKHNPMLFPSTVLFPALPGSALKTSGLLYLFHLSRFGSHVLVYPEVRTKTIFPTERIQQLCGHLWQQKKSFELSPFHQIFKNKMRC